MAFLRFPFISPGIGDFGRSPFGCELLLSSEDSEPQVLELPAEALSSRSKFKARGLLNIINLLTYSLYSL